MASTTATHKEWVSTLSTSTFSLVLFQGFSRLADFLTSSIPTKIFHIKCQRFDYSAVVFFNTVVAAHTAREPAEVPQATAFILYVASPSKDEMSMQKIQHSNSLPIGIHPPWTTDESQGPRPAGEEVGSCVPNSLQLWPCIYKADEESPWDPHKGAQSCHQTGRDREVSHSRVRLGTASPNTVGEDQRAGPSEQHHTAHQRDSTHLAHWFRADQHMQTKASPFRNAGNQSWTMPQWWTLPTPHHATPGNLWWNNRRYLACYVSVN